MSPPTPCVNSCGDLKGCLDPLRRIARASASASTASVGAFLGWVVHDSGEATERCMAPNHAFAKTSGESERAFREVSSDLHFCVGHPTRPWPVKTAKGQTEALG